MKAIWKWIAGSLWPFVKAHWKPILSLALGIAGVYVGRRLYGQVVDAIFGHVDNSTFTPIAGDPAHVIVPTVNGPQVVRLPVDSGGHQVTSDTPGLRVGYAPGYAARVEVSNEQTQRR